MHMKAVGGFLIGILIGTVAAGVLVMGAGIILGTNVVKVDSNHPVTVNSGPQGGLKTTGTAISAVHPASSLLALSSEGATEVGLALLPLLLATAVGAAIYGIYTRKVESN